MKKWICLLLLAVSCTGSKGQKEFEIGKIRVLSTTAMIGDIVTDVGGERVNNQVLIQGEIDPHSYELVKGDDEKILGAQVIFYNGLGLEHGASLHYQLAHHSNAVGLGDRLREKKPEVILITEEGEVDPHVWMDVALWKETVSFIVDELSALDPEGKEFYEKRSIALKEKLNATDLKMREVLHNIPEEKRYLITSHDAFGYFTKRYLALEGEENWKERVIAPEGLAPEGQLSIADLRRVIDHLRLHQVRVVFPESNVNSDPLRKIAHVCKIAVCEEALYGDSMGEGSYIDMMMHNADVIRRAWEQ